MNFELKIISNDASAIARVLAALDAGGPTVSAASRTGPVISVPAMPPMPSGDTDDDDNGPVAAVADGALDADGLPWDERIHAKSKAQVAGDRWRKRRGVDDATVAMVEAQLRGAAAPAMPSAAPVTPPPAPMALPPVPMTAAPVAPPMPIPDAPGTAPAMPPMPPVAPIAPPMPAAPAASPVVDQAAPMDMATFMQHISVKMTEKDGAGAPLVHMEYLQGLATQIATAFNSPVASITDIGTNPNMITYAAQLMQRDGKW